MEVVVSSGNNNVMRDYRKGNWTLQETMVLIEAKRMDDERRMRRQTGESSSERGKPTELRWKWVEDYCWNNGCLRSQNQCNDKWDNLMRDFKKVREFERRLVGDNDDDGEGKSYWKMERNERKENNLPTNLLREIYDALVEVVDRKGQRVVVGGMGVGSTSGFIHQLPPPMQQQQQPQIAALPLPPPPRPPPPPPPPLPPAQTPPPPPPQLHYQHQAPCPAAQPFPRMCDSSDPDTSEHSDSPAKRRRIGVDQEGTQSEKNSHEVGPAISRSAALIAEAIQSCEEREERRHRELLSLHERRLQIEESKAEINRQGINGLVDAINRLASSILALATNKNQR